MISPLRRRRSSTHRHSTSRSREMWMLSRSFYRYCICDVLLQMVSHRFDSRRATGPAGRQEARHVWAISRLHQHSPLAVPAPGLSARPMAALRPEHQGVKWGAGGRKGGQRAPRKRWIRVPPPQLGARFSITGESGCGRFLFCVSCPRFYNRRTLGVPAASRGRCFSN